MRTPVVVELDPVADHAHRMLLTFEAVAMHALIFRVRVTRSLLIVMSCLTHQFLTSSVPYPDSAIRRGRVTADVAVRPKSSSRVPSAGAIPMDSLCNHPDMRSGTLACSKPHDWHSISACFIDF
jgi:hypothetical protein